MKKFCILFCFTMAACSSKEAEYEPPKKVQMKHEWDHEQVRASRAAEAIEKKELDEKSMEIQGRSCDIISKDAMIRNKRSGCKPVDPRLGMGANHFCCPKDPQ